MKARPLLMKGNLVLASLRGDKTQIRRVMNPQPEHKQVHEFKGRTIYDGEHRMWCWKDLVLENLIDFPNNADQKVLAARAPLGRPGDLLWVRENFGSQVRRHGGGTGEFTVYHADDPDAIDYESACGRKFPVKWTPSIHMPRRLSRLTLRITDVRVQRLQDISEEDAIAEGLIPVTSPQFKPMWRYDSEKGGDFSDPRTAYRFLWEMINGPGSWDANPWIWAISYTAIAANVDQVCK